MGLTRKQIVICRAGVRHVRDGSEPDRRRPGAAVGHDRDERRRLHGAVAHHRLHAGERHHDPHHGFLDGPLHHQAALPRVHGYLHVGQLPCGLGSQLRRAAAGPARAGRRRGHPHAPCDDGAHVDVPRGQARYGHGPVRHRHRVRPRHRPHRGGRHHRPLHLARYVLHHHRAVGRRSAYRRVRAAEGRRNEEGRHARRALRHPVVAGFRRPIVRPVHHRLLRPACRRYRRHARWRGSARVLLPTPAEDGEAHAAGARAAEPQVPHRHDHRHVGARRAFGCRHLGAYLPAVAHGLLRHRVRPRVAARRHHHGCHGAHRRPSVRQARTARAGARGHGRAHADYVLLRIPEHRNRHHHLDPSVHRAPVLAVAGEHAHHHLGHERARQRAGEPRHFGEQHVPPSGGLAGHRHHRFGLHYRHEHELPDDDSHASQHLRHRRGVRPSRRAVPRRLRHGRGAGEEQTGRGRREGSGQLPPHGAGVHHEARRVHAARQRHRGRSHAGAGGPAHQRRPAGRRTGQGRGLRIRRRYHALPVEAIADADGPRGHDHADRGRRRRQPGLRPQATMQKIIF